MHPVNSFRNVFLLKIKVADWNHHQNGDWWRDTEFLCPATLKAVVKLSTMVIKEKSHVFCCMNCSLVSFYTLELFFQYFCSEYFCNFLKFFYVREYEEKVGKMEKTIVDQGKEIVELQDKVKTLMGEICFSIANSCTNVHCWKKSCNDALSPLLQYSLEPVNEKGLSCFSAPF